MQMCDRYECRMVVIKLVACSRYHCDLSSVSTSTRAVSDPARLLRQLTRTRDSGSTHPERCQRHFRFVENGLERSCRFLCACEATWRGFAWTSYTCRNGGSVHIRAALEMEGRFLSSRPPWRRGRLALSGSTALPPERLRPRVLHLWRT